jgi:predicted RNA-binding protein YlqC (UPF0109 family)
VRDLALQLGRGLVHEPDRVRVRERREGERVLLEVGVDPDDRGRLIGRGGRTADALRTVLDAVARRQGRSCRLEILDQ